MHKSLTASIALFKLNEEPTPQKKSSLRWQLLTLFLIILIILIFALIAQFIQSIAGTKSYPKNSSFLFSLAKQTHSLTSVRHLTILHQSLPPLSNYRTSKIIYLANNLAIGVLSHAISLQANILFLFTTAQTHFGIFITSNIAAVFNFKNGNSMIYNSCEVIRKEEDRILLIQSITLHLGNKLIVNVSQPNCFDEYRGKELFLSVTGLQSDADLLSLQVYQLS